jgi:hypothetical protein
MRQKVLIVQVEKNYGLMKSIILILMFARLSMEQLVIQIQYFMTLQTEFIIVKHKLIYKVLVITRFIHGLNRMQSIIVVKQQLLLVQIVQEN